MRQGNNLLPGRPRCRPIRSGMEREIGELQLERNREREREWNPWLINISARTCVSAVTHAVWQLPADNGAKCPPRDGLGLAMAMAMAMEGNPDEDGNGDLDLELDLDEAATTGQSWLHLIHSAWTWLVISSQLPA